MGASQLGLYNGALRLLKERKLASLSEDREGRRLLDDAWGDGATNGSVRRCLELGQWSFATRTVQADYDTDIAPPFGYTYAFAKPSDLVRICGVWSDERATNPVTEYADERGYWYSDLQTLYASYVSNGVNYGADLSQWPELFAKVVEADLAMEIAPSLTTSDDKLQLVSKAFEQALKNALATDAMNLPTRFAPSGSWVRSRMSSGANQSYWNQGWR